MRRYFNLFVLLLLVLPVVAHAQQQTPRQDPQAISILNRSLAAMGGQGVASIQDTVVKGTVSSPGSQDPTTGSVTITTKGANMFRTDSEGGGKSASVIFNNGREMRQLGKGWQTAPSANANHKRFEHLPGLMLAYEVVRNELSAEYVGEESIEGRSVDHVSLKRVSNRGDALDETFTRNSQIDVFVDTQTHFITKISYLLLSEIDWRRGFPMEIYFDDYRVANGVAVPFHQRTFFQGQAVNELRISSVAVNQGIPDSKFEAQ
jgi:outer membrane lipoprotein-sorting protein